MAEAKNDDLSASLEDYLEAIFNIAGQSKIARSKDIAEMIGVSKSSVTGALRILKEKGLANYEPYGYVTLTQAGQSAAAEIARKHSILKSFFVNVLGIQADVAQKAACEVEHALGPAIITKLLRFIEFMAQGGKNGYDVADEFKRFCENRSQKSSNKVGRPAGNQQMERTHARLLSSVKAGETVRLARVEAGRDLKSRLASMGLVTDADITVVSNSHPGPFVISVKDSKMMLGRGMANKIMVSEI